MMVPSDSDEMSEALMPCVEESRPRYSEAMLGKVKRVRVLILSRNFLKFLQPQLCDVAMERERSRHDYDDDVDLLTSR